MSPNLQYLTIHFRIEAMEIHITCASEVAVSLRSPKKTFEKIFMAALVNSVINEPWNIIILFFASLSENKVYCKPE